MKHVTLYFAIIILHASVAYSQTPELVVPVGHKFGIRCAVFSSDNRFVLSAGLDQSIKVWEAKSGMLLKTLVSTSPVFDAVFTNDDKYIIAATLDGVLIWEMSTMRPPRKIESGPSYSARVTSDNSAIVIHSVINDVRQIAVWNFNSGKQIRLLASGKKEYLSEIMYTVAILGYGHRRYEIRLNADASLVVGPLTDYVAGIWDVKSGQLLQRLVHQSEVSSIEFSPDGKTVLTKEGRSVFVWDVATGKLSKTFEVFAPNSWWGTAVFGSADSVCLTTSLRQKKIGLWNIKSGQQVGSLETDTTLVTMNTNRQGNQLVAATADNSMELWNLETGRLVVKLTGSTEVTFAKLSRDKSLLGVAAGENLSLFDLGSGTLLKNFEKGNSPRKNDLDFPAFRSDELDFSANGELVAWLDGKGIITVLNRKTGRLRQLNPTVTPQLKSVFYDQDGVPSLNQLRTSLFFGNGGNSIYTIDQGNSILKWNLASEEFTRTIASPSGSFLTIDSKERILVNDRMNLTAAFLSGEEQHENFKYYAGDHKTPIVGLVSATISPSHEYLAIHHVCDTTRIWNLITKKLVKSIPALAGQYPDEYWNCVQYPNGNYSCTPDQKNFMSGNYLNLHAVEFSDDTKKLIFPTIDERSLVLDLESGRVDTLQGFVQGVNWKTGLAFVIDDHQLKIVDIRTRETKLIWIPIGRSDYVITHPSGLFDASPGAMNKLHFIQGMDVIQFDQLKERYYEPQLLKKIMAGEPLRKVDEFKSIDLPPDVQLGQVDDKGYLTISLINRGGGIGEVNVFINGKEAIKDARKSKEYVNHDKLALKVFIGNSRAIVKGQENLIGVKAWNKEHWVVSRSQVITYKTKEMEKYHPSIYILTCGISDYMGTEIDLKYAAKDADDVSQALQLGAHKLFGAEKSYVYNLTTSGSKEFYPTKNNILKAFEEISKKAHPLDIFVVYISGHGINYGGQEGDWYYLTRDAYTANSAAYHDPAIRKSTTLSSNELIELFKKVPVLKQVLLIDACASGKVVDNLVEKRDIESGTLRALDRMRDRTGMHIITGCTADAVSYEASKFGQGILTYSLLEGIRGAALREDQYVDVNKLFQYAQERVPQLAEGIGGIQSPQVFSPQGAQSYDIGLLTDQEKKAIPIASIRPVYIRSNFIDDDQLADDLQLGKLIDESLNEVASRGSNAPIIFVDVRNYPEGCKLSGRYRQESGSIKLKLRRKCGNEDIITEINGQTPTDLAEQILKLL